MTSTITAIFETYDIAETVRQEIGDLGVGAPQIMVVPDGSGQTVAGEPRSDDEVAEIQYLHIPSEDVRVYQQAVREGHYVVSADVEDAHVDRVIEIMRHPDRGGVDIDAYAASFQSRDDYDDTTVPLEGYDRTDIDGEEHVQLAEERIKIGKRAVDRGTSTVRTYVQEVPVEERIRLREEHVSIRRRPVERVVRGAEADEVFEERVIKVTETDEEAVIDKETVITEEVVIAKEVEEREEVVRDTVRKTEVEVDEANTRIDPDKPRI